MKNSGLGVKMAGHIDSGHTNWWLEVSREGYRTYHLVFRVRMDSSLDGPATALSTIGLPSIGDTWNIDNDSDPWVWCRPTAKVRPVTTGEPNEYFDIEFEFSNEPLQASQQRCNDIRIEDPLLEPPKVSGSYSNFSEEATHDRFGRQLTNSSFEQLKGAEVEFDISRHTVKIEMNILNLDLAFYSAFINRVNSFPLWGLGRRCWKMHLPSWDRKYYGVCSAYYTVTLEFEGNPLTWDRDILDEGNKALKGHWDNSARWILDNIDGNPPNRFNPNHFIKVTDLQGNPMHVLLNGRGQPAPSEALPAGYFLSLTDTNQGNEVTDPEHWIPITNISADTWVQGRYYARGTVVNYVEEVPNTIYIALQNVPASDNPGYVPPNNTTLWQALDDFTNTGADWSAGTSYSEGDVVISEANSVGNIHIEYYSEADFTLLGIPTIL